MTAAWTLWLLAIGVSFAIFEGYAIKTGNTTLSRFVWTLSKAWPPFPWVVGLITGFVAAHLWWGGALICYAPVQ
jgi:hypothetical protein